MADILVCGHIENGATTNDYVLRLDAVNTANAGTLASVTIPVNRTAEFTRRQMEAMDSKVNELGPLVLDIDGACPLSQCAFDLDQINVDTTTTALNTLIVKSLAARSSTATRPPTVAPLFFSNRTKGSDRLDAFESELFDSFSHAAREKQITCIDFPYSGTSATEFYLRLSGLTQADPEKVSKVASLYVWGYFAETNAANLPHDDIPVQLTLYMWPGSGTPTSIVVTARLGELPQLREHIVEIAVTELSHTATNKVKEEDRHAVANVLRDEYVHRKARLDAIEEAWNTIGTSPEDAPAYQHNLLQLKRLLQIARFMTPENRNLAKRCLQEGILSWREFVDQYDVISPNEAETYLSEIRDCNGSFSGIGDQHFADAQAAYSRYYSADLIRRLSDCLSGPHANFYIPCFTSGYFRTAIEAISDPTQRVNCIQTLYPYIAPHMAQGLWTDVSLPMMKAFMDVGRAGAMPQSKWAYPGRLTREQLIGLSANDWDKLMQEEKRLRSKEGRYQSSKPWVHFKAEHEAQLRETEWPKQTDPNSREEQVRALQNRQWPIIQRPPPLLPLPITPVLAGFTYSNHTAQLLAELNGKLFIYATDGEHGDYGSDLICEYDPVRARILSITTNKYPITSIQAFNGSIWVASKGGGSLRLPDNKRYLEADVLP